MRSSIKILKAKSCNTSHIFKQKGVFIYTTERISVIGFQEIQQVINFSLKSVFKMCISTIDVERPSVSHLALNSNLPVLAS